MNKLDGTRMARFEFIMLILFLIGAIVGVTHIIQILVELLP